MGEIRNSNLSFSGRNFQFDFISFDIIKTVSTLDKKKYKICSPFKSEI